VYGVSIISHGPLLDRYVLSTILGFSFGIYCLHLPFQRLAPALLAGLALLLAYHEVRFWREALHTDLRQAPMAFAAFVEDEDHQELPIVIADGVEFLQIAKYAPSDLQKRLIYLTDSMKSIEYSKSHSDSVDKDLVILKRYLPFQMFDFAEFVCQHPAFLLYTDNRDTAANWISPYLSLSQQPMTLIREADGRKLILFRLRRLAGPSGRDEKGDR
jgi:hypothetical protein